jgi:hypothetical protein
MLMRVLRTVRARPEPNLSMAWQMAEKKQDGKPADSSSSTLRDH